MKKFILFVEAFLILSLAAKADDNVASSEFDKIVQICAPKQTNEYVPDLIVAQQFNDSSNCLLGYIENYAKDIFNDNIFEAFKISLYQASNAYFQMMSYLTTQTKDVDNLSGTLEDLKIQSDRYAFLHSILKRVIDIRYRLIEETN